MKNVFYEINTFSDRHVGLSVTFFFFFSFILSSLVTLLDFDVVRFLFNNQNELSETQYKFLNALLLTLFFGLAFSSFLVFKVVLVYLKEVIEIEKDYWKK